VYVEQYVWSCVVAVHRKGTLQHVLSSVDWGGQGAVGGVLQHAWRPGGVAQYVSWLCLFSGVCTHVAGRAARPSSVSASATHAHKPQASQNPLFPYTETHRSTNRG
jgi:hypothetical protein